MCICVHVCILILFCLFIIYVVGAYSKHPSIFFFGKHSCRKITDLCLCLVPFSDSSGLFVWPHCGLQHSAAASIAQGQGTAGPDSCSGVQLLIDLRPSLPHQIGDFAPCACSSPVLHPCPWMQCHERPRDPVPETSTSCWKCRSSEEARKRGLFRLKIGQDLIQMQIHS